jgi:hypothetical protein
MVVSNTEALEGASIDDLQSQSLARRVRALEILCRNASKLYGDTAPVTAAERRRLEDARLELAQRSSGSGSGMTNIEPSQPSS